MKKWIRRGYMLLAIGLIIGFVGFHFIAPYGILQPTRVVTDFHPDSLGLSSRLINIPFGENEQLVGYEIPSAIDTTFATIILVHGVGGCKEHFIPLAGRLSEMGITCMLFDNRAHGQSGGDYCTYGFYEKKDIQKIVEYIKRNQPNQKIGIWGNSLGGAIAIQALEIEKRIDFGIIESTFTDLEDIVYDYKKRILKGIAFRPLSDYALIRAGQIADFPPEQVRPLLSVQNITQPVLIAHGDADKNISVDNGLALYDALLSKDKTLVIVEKGGHEGLMKTGGASYFERIKLFIKKQI